MDAKGGLHVVQRPHDPLGDAGEALAAGAAAPPAGTASVFIAALPPDGAAPASGHFNGKIERPALWRDPGSTGLLAGWDFSVDILHGRPRTDSLHRMKPTRGWPTCRRGR